VLALTREILTLEAEGNFAKAQNMIGTWAVIRPEVQRTLDKLKVIPIDIEPSFTAAERLLAAVKK
jgi:hypothetical protein